MFAVVFIWGNQGAPSGNFSSCGSLEKSQSNLSIEPTMANLACEAQTHFRSSLLSRPEVRLRKPGISGFSKDTRLKMAVQFPPFRSLQDFVTDAQFTAPTFRDRDRMENRMVNNLIYYQTNYFLCAILILILVG